MSRTPAGKRYTNVFLSIGFLSLIFSTLDLWKKTCILNKHANKSAQPTIPKGILKVIIQNNINYSIQWSRQK